jgi:PleD family two-component response regulator
MDADTFDEVVAVADAALLAAKAAGRNRTVLAGSPVTGPAPESEVV